MEGEGDALDAGNTVSNSTAVNLKNSGNEKFNKNDYKGAIADYKKGLRHEPNNCDLHANLSAAYIHLEKYVEAEEHATFAIHLRPTFYKGYMRAAKASHGKGMTRLSLIRLAKGLQRVTDPDGVKELTRLKNQYTGYLSLAVNADREMTFDTDAESEEECDGMVSDRDDDSDCDDTDDDNDDDDLPPPSQSIAVPTTKPAETITLSSKLAVNEGKTAELNGLLDFKLPASGLDKELTPNHTSVPPLKKTAEEKENKSGKDTENNETDKEEGESFPELAKESTKNPNLHRDQLVLKELLRCGTEAFHNNNFRKASECYKAARERVGIKLIDYEIDERQLHVIKYAYCAALISSNIYDDIVKAIQELNNMESNKSSIPAIYIQMARAYCKLNRFKNALEPLEKIQEIIDNCPIFPTFTWPGTDKTIEETTPNGLKNAIKDISQQSRMSHKASAVCRYENCLKISTHILPSVNIYTSDPDFIGFVRMICEEKCHIEYHIACWKAYKEHSTGVEKVNDKDFLGGTCFTTDCLNGDGEPSVIVTVEIIGSDGQVKSVNKLDSKAIVDTKKSRKKKGKLDEKEEKEKEKEKEKAEKTKKNKDKQEKIIKKLPKPVKMIEDIIDEDLDELEPKCSDPVQEHENRLESMDRLRTLKFGCEKAWYNPTLNYYGREDEKLKAALGNCWVPNSFDSPAVKDAKEFIFSYFQSTLKEEGPLTLKEVEELWKDSSDNFCDIKSVIPNMKNTVHLLLESPRFCQVENYVCLLDQIGESYKNVDKEVSDVVNYLVAGSKANVAKATEQQKKSGVLTKGESQHKDGDNRIIWASSSDDESEDESDDDEVSLVTDSDASSDDEDQQDKVYSDIDEPIEETAKPLHENLPQINPSTISVGDLLSHMTSFLDEFKLPSSERVHSSEEHERIKEAADECASNDTADYVSAHGSPDKNMAIVLSPEEQKRQDNLTKALLLISHQCKVLEKQDEAVDETELKEVDDVVEETECIEEPAAPTEQESDPGSELDKASQSGVSVENQLIQTSVKETKNSHSQTTEADVFREINKQMKELQVKLANSEKARVQAVNDLAVKESTIKQLKDLQEEAMANCKKVTRKYDDVTRVHQTKIAEFTKKEANIKKLLDELKHELEQTKSRFGSITNENQQLKDKNGSLMKDVQDLREKWTSAMNTIKENEKRQNSIESVTKTSLQKSHHNQLITIKAYWDTQISQLKKRCVEKISEIQNFFKVLPSEDVEGLPSLAALYHNTQQWKEIMAKLQQIETGFQSKYASVEAKILRGEKIEDLTLAVLPVLPDEPSNLSLDTIMRDVMEKYNKRQAESVDKTQKLTLLVANQQLELEKSKDAIQQFQQLINSYQMAPRMSTTSFGGLAMQFPFPQNMAPQAFNPSQPPASIIPTIPPPIADTSSVGSQKTLADVQALLQESSRAAASVGTVKKPLSEEPEFLSEISFLGPSLDVMKPPPMTIPPPIFTAPPPIHGVAHKVLQAAAVSEPVKDIKLPERSVTSKSEHSVPSREQTPVPSAVSTPVSMGSPTPNAEKTKKKKKVKSEGKEVPVNVAVNVVPSSATITNGLFDDPVAVNDWNYVLTAGNRARANETAKQKTKRRLMEQLLLKFDNITMKDMEEIVKRLRELNNNKLSGLAYHEIESRVHRYIAQRAKTKIWGLTKFTDVPWGNAGKQDSNKPRPNLHLDECIVCLENMTDKTKTKLDCNHEFHTQCLRKWLKEKRVCPLCNKFAAMPDEFPAL